MKIGVPGVKVGELRSRPVSSRRQCSLGGNMFGFGAVRRKVIAAGQKQKPPLGRPFAIAR